MGVDVEKSEGGGIELPRELINVATPAMRQGLIVVNDPREAEMVVQFFTGMIINKDPSTITDWRREYINVSSEEFQEELRLLVMPLLVEQPIGKAINPETGRSFVVIMRRVYIINLAPPTGLIVFGQPSIALIINDDNKIYLGYKGIDVGTGNRITVTVKSTINEHATIPFTPAIARFVFIGDVVEAIIESNGQLRGLKR
jgi:hypothetical protein